MIGVLPIGPGSVLNLLADKALKEKYTTVKPLQVSSSLVTNGVFRLSRHPMYLGMVLILAGIAIFMGSATRWVTVALCAFLIQRVFIRVEEFMLEETFGQEYVDYKLRVRQWI